jgi:hypothetical protein
MVQTIANESAPARSAPQTQPTASWEPQLELLDFMCCELRYSLQNLLGGGDSRPAANGGDAARAGDGGFDPPNYSQALLPDSFK